MICPNCFHPLDDSKMEGRSLPGKKRIFSGVCERCQKISYFLYSWSEEQESWSVYSWLKEREEVWAKSISAFMNYKYVVFFYPESNLEEIKKKIRSFLFLYGESSVALFLPESSSKILEYLPSSLPSLKLKDGLFPEIPSYLAEKLILENTLGKKFIVGEPLFSEEWERI